MRFISTTVTRLGALAIAALLFAGVLASPAGAAPFDSAHRTVVVVTATPGAAAASPDGHAAVNNASVAAVTAAPDGHAGLNPNGDAARVHAIQASAPELTPTTGTTDRATVSSGDETPWAAIGLGGLGVLLLLAGTTVFVRRHGSDGRHAAAGV